MAAVKPEDRCAFPGCGIYRRDHDGFVAAARVGQLHTFVDPAPVPDAARDVAEVIAERVMSEWHAGGQFIGTFATTVLRAVRGGILEGRRQALEVLANRSCTCAQAIAALSKEER